MKILKHIAKKISNIIGKIFIPPSPKSLYGHSLITRTFKDFLKFKIISEYNYQRITTTFNTLQHSDDYAVELLMDGDKIKDYKFVSIDRWYDPDCIPAIISYITYPKNVNITVVLKHNDGDTKTTKSINSSVIAVLHAMDKYFCVDDLFMVQLPDELIKQAETRFQERGINHVVDGTKHNGFKSKATSRITEIIERDFDQISAFSGRIKNSKRPDDFNSEWLNQHFSAFSTEFTRRETAKIKDQLEQFRKDAQQLRKQCEYNQTPKIQTRE